MHLIERQARDLHVSDDFQIHISVGLHGNSLVEFRSETVARGNNISDVQLVNGL